MTLKEVTVTGFALALGFGFFGCRTTEYADPAPEIARLDSVQAEAVKNNVDVLSPAYFKRSAEELQKAKERNSKGKDPSSELKEASRDLDKAIETAKPARTALQPTLEARNKAIAARAEYFEPNAWDKAEKRFKKTTDDVGKGDLRAVEKNKNELTTLYQNLEVDAIVGAQMNKAKNDFAQAEKDNAKKYAPETYNTTKDLLRNQEQAIRADRYNTQVLTAARDQTTAAAARLIRITSEARRLGSEKVALEIEAKDAQAAAAQQAAQQKLAAEQQAAQQATAEAQAAQRQLAAADQQLADQKAMDQKFQQAKARFSSSEADVYQDGQNILIRLKGLNFKAGKADLGTANKALVVKVGEVISMYGQPNVKVEGHTDSSGTRATNIRLSDERAKVVKNALIRDTNLPATKITSEGFGDSQPIASNKTASGRTQNRRVDVVITPTQQVAH